MMKQNLKVEGWNLKYTSHETRIVNSFGENWNFDLTRRRVSGYLNDGNLMSGEGSKVSEKAI